MAISGYLKQSTAVSVMIGPFVDDSDGNTDETSLTISQADVRLSKNAGNMAQKNSATACTHDELGIYSCPLSTTDTNTLGILTLTVHESGALPVRHDFMVLPANVYDSLVGGSDALDVNISQISEDATAANNAESFFDGTGYAGTNNVIPTVTNVTNLHASAATAAALTTVDGNVDSILADTNELQTDWANGGRLDLLIDAILADTGELQTDWTDGGRLDLIIDAILADTNELQTDDIPGAISGLNNISTAEVNTEVDNAIETYHLDHLFAVTYDPASKPGTADALLNELIESDSGVSRFTENALEQGPGGGSAPTVEEIRAEIDSNSTQLAAIVADTGELQTDWTDGGRLDLIIDAILADTNELQTDDIPGAISGLNNISTAQVNAEVDTALGDYDGPTHDELLGYVQLLARSDANIISDRSTELSAINADEGSGTGDYAPAADSLEASQAEHDATQTDISGLNDPTAAAIRAEIDSNSTQLAAIVADTNELQTDLTDGGRLDLLIDAILADTGELQTDWVDGGRLDLIIDAILADTNELQTDDIPGAISGLNNISTAEVNTEVDNAIETYHLDHLLAVTYDPASKPGAADALLNEIIENDSGVSRFTENALEQAPTGGSAPTVEEIRAEIDSNSTQLAAIVADTGELQTDWTDGGRLDLLIDAILADTGELQTDWTNGGRLDLIIDAILADTNELQTDDIPGAISGLNNISTAEVNTEVDNAIETYHLDHLLAATYDPASKPGAADALLNEIVENDGGVSRFTSNALEQAPTGGSNPNVLLDTTIATVNSQTEIVLSAGSDDDDAYQDQAIVLYDASNSDFPSVRTVSVYDGDTLTATLSSAPDFTILAGDGVTIFVTAPGSTAPTVEQIRAEIDSNSTQLAAIVADTGELQTDWTDGGRLDLLIDAILADTGELQTDWVDGGRLDLIIDAILADTNELQTDDIPGAIAGLNNISAAQVNTEVDNAIETYGLDHLVSASVVGADVADDSIIAQLVSDSATADWDDYDNTTDSLEASQVEHDATQTAISGLNDPTAAAIRTEIDSNSTQLAAIVADTNELQTDWVDGGRLDLLIDAILADTGELQADWTNGGRLDLIIDAILADTNELQSDDVPGLIAALENISAAQVNAEVDSAIETYHLDHLFATDYDPASKPGTATALLNELIENDGGISRFTANALEQGPTGGSAPTVEEIRTEMDDNSTQLAAIVTDTNELQTDWANGGRLDLLIDAILADTGELQTDWANGGRLDLIIDAILADTNELQSDDVPGLIAALENISTAQVNAEIVDALATDTYAEPSGVPAATATLATKVGYLYMALRNEIRITSNKKTFYDDGGNPEWEKDLSDDATTYTESEGNAI